MPFSIVRQDITKMQVDAIVNAANTQLLMGGGVCGAIFNAAGPKELQRACDRLAPIRTGEAAITPGFRLQAKYVIHAAGPMYNPQNREKCEELLYSAYAQSLKLAAEKKCESIAFPLISSGIYGYPKEDALRVATTAITDFLRTADMDVYLAIFHSQEFSARRELANRVEYYISAHYDEPYQFQLYDMAPSAVGSAALDSAAPDSVEPDNTKETVIQGIMRPKQRKSFSLGSASTSKKSPPPVGAAAPKASIENWIQNLDEPFSDTLFKLIDSKGKTDVEVYKRANIDRKLFSKIRSVKGYTPKKPTILALAIALELSLDETKSLLERAGYALSHASKFDLIVEFFIVTGQYNIYDINEMLFLYDQPLLGA